MSMRLDKYLANSTHQSRSVIRRCIYKGEVSIDGITVTDPSTRVDLDSNVIIHGESVQYQQFQYFMLHKPVDTVSANRDRRHETVLDLVYEPGAEKLHVAGRLDKDATGLVLLTDDGQWTHRVISPRRQCAKEYIVHLQEPVTEAMLEKLRTGVWLEGEKKKTLPAEVEILADDTVSLTITEGKYHQVKRMFAAVGNQVIALHRIRIGNIRLDPSLARGEYRVLTREEIESVS